MWHPLCPERLRRRAGRDGLEELERLATRKQPFGAIASHRHKRSAEARERPARLATRCCAQAARAAGTHPDTVRGVERRGAASCELIRIDGAPGACVLLIGGREAREEHGTICK